MFGTDYDTPDGTAIRDYVHVIDLADAHVRAIEHLERGGDSTVVNLGTGKGSSVLEVIDVANRVSGREIPVEKLGRRAGDPVVVYADLRARARRCSGGRRSSASTRSSRARGSGTRRTRTGTSPEAHGVRVRPGRTSRGSSAGATVSSCA